MPTATPEIRLVNAFVRPYENAVATARTCYSSRGIVTPEAVSGAEGQDEATREKRAASRDRIARSVYQAGHHTTLQHAHFQFSMDGVSRQFLWAFLHAHPFYNSEQVSQRYVEVKADRFVTPPLTGEAGEAFQTRLAGQTEDYRALIAGLTPLCERAYFQRFPSRRRKAAKYAGEIRKRAQEIARYVLPLATPAYLYHTVSALTLMRYRRLCRCYDAPREQSEVVERMVQLVLAFDPLLEQILEEPLDLESTAEHAFFVGAGFGHPEASGWSRQAAEEFDASLGGRVSRLVDWKPNAEEVVASAVREVLGVPRANLSDDDALGLVLDPPRNALHAETMNVATLGKLTRALHHPAYTFRKRLSHTADSQDQRHRMTPASRPCVQAYLADEPDYVTPALVLEDSDVQRAYDESMARTWETLARLERLGVSAEDRAYLLPNAVTLRFTESSDLLNLQHKLKMRLCYNAQEEIWRASRDEALQVEAVTPRLGRSLQPPCALRHASDRTPPCPEGARYCGVRVWTLEPADYERLI